MHNEHNSDNRPFGRMVHVRKQEYSNDFPGELIFAAKQCIIP